MEAYDELRKIPLINWVMLTAVWYFLLYIILNILESWWDWYHERRYGPNDISSPKTVYGPHSAFKTLEADYQKDRKPSKSDPD